MLRISALAAVVKAGRFGADKGAPGVTLSVIHPVTIVMAIARKGKAKALGTALGFSSPSAVIPAPSAVILAQAGIQLSTNSISKNLDSRLRGNDGPTVHWAGADQYYIYNAPYTELKQQLEGLASLTDQSHGRVVLRISGPKSRAVLAKGTAVDLHESKFPIGKSALTQMAHVSVHLTRSGDNEFTLSVFRGFSESFWQWLVSQAGEFGYQVT